MTDLFNETPAATPNHGEPAPENQTPANTDLLSGIKNENGEQKFKTAEDLARGYEASQAFIATLKSEKESVEAKVQELSGKVLSQEELKSLLQPAATPPAAIPAAAEPVAGLQSADVLDILEQRDNQRAIEANVTSVKEAAAKAFGADAVTKLEELSGLVGLSKAAAQSLAQTSPGAFMKLIGITPEGTPSSSPNQSPSSVNTQTFLNGGEIAPKQVMRSGKSSDFMAEWRANKKRCEERNA
jgi:hypothetical protein